MSKNTIYLEVEFIIPTMCIKSDDSVMVGFCKKKLSQYDQKCKDCLKKNAKTVKRLDGYGREIRYVVSNPVKSVA